MPGCRVFVIFIVVFQTLAFAQTSSITQGVELFRQGKYKEALQQLEAAERLQPSNPVIPNLLGITETKLGNIAAADMYYKTAIHLSPEMPAPYKNLGFNELNAKKYTSAEKALNTALALSPEDPFIHYYLAVLYLNTSRDGQAIKQLGPARSLVESDPLTAIQMVKACIQMNMMNEATPLISSLESRSAISSTEEYQLAILMSVKHMYPEAVERFQRAAEMEPEVWGNQYNLAIAMLNAGQNKAAVQVLEHLASLRPKDANIDSLLGIAYEASGQLTQALRAYRGAILLDPRNQDRYLDYSRLLMEMDRFDEATEFIREGEKVTPDAYGLQLRLGAVQMMEGNYTDARHSFQQCIDRHPEIVIGHIALAQTYMKQGKETQAAAVLQSAQKLFPNDFMVEYFSGLVLSRLGEEKESLAAMESAVRLGPNVVEGHFELGKLFLQMDKIPQAEAEFQRVIALDPEMARSYYELSRIYARLGESEKAKQMAKTAKAMMETQRQAALKAQMLRLGGFHSDDKVARQASTP